MMFSELIVAKCQQHFLLNIESQNQKLHISLSFQTSLQLKTENFLHKQLSQLNKITSKSKEIFLVAKLHEKQEKEVPWCMFCGTIE